MIKTTYYISCNVLFLRSQNCWKKIIWIHGGDNRIVTGLKGSVNRYSGRKDCFLPPGLKVSGPQTSKKNVGYHLEGGVMLIWYFLRAKTYCSTQLKRKINQYLPRIIKRLKRHYSAPFWCLVDLQDMLPMLYTVLTTILTFSPREVYGKSRKPIRTL